MTMQSLRMSLLGALSVGLACLVVGTVWFGYQTVNEVRALKDELADSLVTSRQLELKYSALKADLSHSQSSVRLGKLQASKMPDLKRPTAFLNIEDVPFLSEPSHPTDKDND